MHHQVGIHYDYRAGKSSREERVDDQEVIDHEEGGDYHEKVVHRLRGHEEGDQEEGKRFSLPVAVSHPVSEIRARICRA